MGQYTTSCSRGNVAEHHNRRDVYTREKCPENIDFDRIEDNIVLVDRSLQEVFDTTFGNAVEKYNEKKREKHRLTEQIDNYLAKIEGQTNKAKPLYEYVLQIGNVDDHPPANECAAILTRWLEEFRERYGANWEVVQAIIHMDEATPHMHLEVVPVARDQKRGLEVQCSQNKAVKQSGYKDWKQMMDGWHGLLDEVMHEFGHEKVLGDHERHDHMTVDQYKQWIQTAEKLTEAQNQAAEAEVRAEVALLAEEAANDRVEAAKERLESVQQCIRGKEEACRGLDEEIAALECQLGEVGAEEDEIGAACRGFEGDLDQLGERIGAAAERCANLRERLYALVDGLVERAKKAPELVSQFGRDLVNEWREFFAPEEVDQRQLSPFELADRAQKAVDAMPVEKTSWQRRR